MLAKAVYGVMLLLIVVKGEKPQCSKFDFEKKVLETMVRMEFEMEKMKLEIQKSVEVVQHMNTRVVNNIDVFTNNREKFDEQMGQLQTLSESQRLHLKQDQNADINVQSGQAFVFPATILNLGNGYDSSSGVFTAPVYGTYVFTAALCVKDGEHLTFAIMVNRNQHSGTQFYGDFANSCHYSDANAVLTAGQKVWVQQIPGNSNYGAIIVHHADCRWNTFFGTLVNS